MPERRFDILFRGQNALIRRLSNLELTGSQSTDNTSATNARVNDGNNIAQLALKCRVKICASLDGTEAVAIR